MEMAISTAQRIKNVIIANKSCDSKGIADALNKDVLEFCAGSPLLDDITLIAAKGKK